MVHTVLSGLASVPPTAMHKCQIVLDFVSRNSPIGNYSRGIKIEVLVLHCIIWAASAVLRYTYGSTSKYCRELQQRWTNCASEWAAQLGDVVLTLATISPPPAITPMSFPSVSETGVIARPFLVRYDCCNDAVIWMYIIIK